MPAYNFSPEILQLIQQLVGPKPFDQTYHIAPGLTDVKGDTVGNALVKGATPSDALGRVSTMTSNVELPPERQALQQVLESPQQIADTRRKGENSPQAVKERAEAMARAQARTNGK